MAVIATVQKVQGAVFAVDVNGKSRLVRNGDQLQEGEVLVTGPGGSAELVFVSGKTLTVPEQQAFLLDPSVGGAVPPDATGAALSPLAQKVIQALKTGDLNTLLETEATAAGVTGSGGGDEGSSFVQVLRQLENADGSHVYQFGPNTFAGLDSSDTTPVPDPVIDNPPAATLTAVNDTGAIGEDSVVSLTGSVFGPENDSTTTVPATLEVTAVRTGTEAAGQGNPGMVGTVLLGQFGSLTLNSDGTYFYSLDVSRTDVQALNVGGTLTDTFTYTVTDGTSSDRAQLVITINGANDGPVAVADVVNGFEDTTLIVASADLFGGTGDDSDIDGPGFETITVTALPDGGEGGGIGTLMLNGEAVTLNQIIQVADIAANQLTFVPNSNASGPASFQYTVSDGSLSSNAATVSINIAPVNDAPVAVNDTVNGSEDTTLTIASADLFGGTGDDSDVDGPGFQTITVTALPAAPGEGGGIGTLMLNGEAVTLNQVISVADIAANQLTFVPNSNASGPASFQYTVSDGSESSNTATVSINIAPVNDAPVAVNDTVNGLEDTTLTIASTDLFGATGDDSDVDGPGFQTITVTALPDGGEGGGIGTLMLNGEAVTLNQVIQVADIAANQLTFVPNSNASGPASFQYTVSDGSESSNAATVSINIAPVNDAPVAVNDTVNGLEDTTLTIASTDLFGATGDDSDVDGPGFQTITVTALPDGGEGGGIGTLMLNGEAVTLNQVISVADIAANQLTFVPNSNASGPASFQYTVSDGSESSNTATVSINIAPVNDAPVAVNDTVNGTEDTTLTIASADLFGGTGDDSDVDGPGFETITVTALPDGGEGGGIGTLMLNGEAVTLNQVIQVADIAANQLTFVPDSNASGPASFQYTVSDGSESSNTATVSINIAPVNDPAIISGTDTDTVLEAGGFNNGTPGDPTGEGDLNATDIDSPATFVAQTGVTTTHGTFTIDATGAWSYTLNNNDLAVQALNTGNTGTTALHDVITVSTADGTTHTVDISINGANDAPTGFDDRNQVVDGGEGPSTTDGNVLVGGENHGNGFFDVIDTDPDSTPLTVTQISSDVDANDVREVDSEGTTIFGQFGQLRIDSTGEYSYFTSASAPQGLDDGEFQSDNFTYRVSDGSLSTTAKLRIAATFGENDPPVAIADSNSLDAVVGNTRTGSVRNNDFDPDDEPLTYTLISSETQTDTPVPNGGNVTIAGEYGNLQFSSDGSYTYTYTTGSQESETDVFNYTVTDGTAFANASLTINIVQEEVLVAPVAENDSNWADAPFDGGEGPAPAAGPQAEGNVLGDGDDLHPGPNGEDFRDVADTDANGDVLRVMNVEFDGQGHSPGTPIQGTYGTLTLNEGGDYTYTVGGSPEAVAAARELDDNSAREEPQEIGQDVFTYTAVDVGLTDQATLTVNVFGHNDAPVAVDDTVTLQSEDGDGTEGGNVISGREIETVIWGGIDTDVDVEALSVTFIDGYGGSASIDGGEAAVVNGQFGSLRIESDGDYIYTRFGSPGGTDEFTYTVSDGDASDTTGALTITLEPQPS